MIQSKGPTQTNPLKKTDEFLDMDIMMWKITSTGFALTFFTACRYRNIKEQLNIKILNFLSSLLCCYCLHSLNAELQGPCWVWKLRHLFGSQLAVPLLSPRQRTIQYLRENSSGTRLKVSCNVQIRLSLDIGPRRQQGHIELQKPECFNPPGKQRIWNWFFLWNDPVIVLTFSEGRQWVFCTI